MTGSLQNLLAICVDNYETKIGAALHLGTEMIKTSTTKTSEKCCILREIVHLFSPSYIIS